MILAHFNVLTELHPLLYTTPVLLGLVVLQVCYWKLSRNALAVLANVAKSSESKDYSGLLLSIENDANWQVGQGQPPNWIAYLDYFDRLVEPQLEKIRQLAGSALATGVGGTMLIFAVEVIAQWGQPLQDLTLTRPTLIGGLLSSIAGITVHLLIVLRTLKQGQEGVDGAERAFRIDLQARIGSTPFYSQFAEEIRHELSKSFAEGIRRFPEIFQQVDKSVQQLQQTVTSQLTEIAATNTGLMARYEELATAAGELAQSTRLLNATTGQIEKSIEFFRALPDSLEASLQRASDAWEREIRAGQESFVVAVNDTLGQQHTLLEKMQNRFESQDSVVREALSTQGARQEEVFTRLDELSVQLREAPEKLRKTHEQLAEIFNQDAGNFVLELNNAFRESAKNLENESEKNQRKLREWFANSSEQVIAQIFERLEEQIQQSIVAPLIAMGSSLETATEALPKAASGFAASIDASALTLAELPASLDTAINRIEQTALATSELGDSLQTALADSTHDAWQPVTRDIDRFVTYAQNAHKELRGTIEGLIKFIDNLTKRRFFRFCCCSFLSTLTADEKAKDCNHNLASNSGPDDRCRHYGCRFRVRLL